MKKLFLVLTCFFVNYIFCDKSSIIEAIDILDINKVQKELSQIQIDQALKTELLDYVDQIVIKEKNKNKCSYKNYSALTNIVVGASLGAVGLRCLATAWHEMAIDHDESLITIILRILRAQPNKEAILVSSQTSQPTTSIPVVAGATLCASLGAYLSINGINKLTYNKNYYAALDIWALIAKN